MMVEDLVFRVPCKLQQVRDALEDLAVVCIEPAFGIIQLIEPISALFILCLRWFILVQRMHWCSPFFPKSPSIQLAIQSAIQSVESSSDRVTESLNEGIATALNTLNHWLFGTWAKSSF